MPEYTQTFVSALELEALYNLDKMIRLAMARPNMGEFLAAAIQALDQVRIDQGLPMPEPIPPQSQNVNGRRAEPSQLATSLIKRAMDGSKS
jgi:hypothetical protein